jgi:hypothetical protein
MNVSHPTFRCVPPRATEPAAQSLQLPAKDQISRHRIGEPLAFVPGLVMPRQFLEEWSKEPKP